MATSSKTYGNPAEEHVLRTLSEFSPMSHRQYSEITGICCITSFARFRKLWDRKMLYIAEYIRNNDGKPTPLYAIGSLDDAKPIKAKTKQESSAEYRKKLAETDPQKLKAQHKASTVKRAIRRKTDKDYAERVKKYDREWRRKKFGYKPRQCKDALSEIAKQFGCTWYFSKSKHKQTEWQ